MSNGPTPPLIRLIDCLNEETGIEPQRWWQILFDPDQAPQGLPFAEFFVHLETPEENWGRDSPLIEEWFAAGETIAETALTPPEDESIKPMERALRWMRSVTAVMTR